MLWSAQVTNAAGTVYRLYKQMNYIMSFAVVCLLFLSKQETGIHFKSSQMSNLIVFVVFVLQLYIQHIRKMQTWHSSQIDVKHKSGLQFQTWLYTWLGSWGIAVCSWYPKAVLLWKDHQSNQTHTWAILWMAIATAPKAQSSDCTLSKQRSNLTC